MTFDGVTSSGVQLCSFWFPHHSAGRPRPAPPNPRLSHRNSILPLSKPSVPQRAGLHSAMPISPRPSSSVVSSELSIAGRCRRKNGMGDELARRIADFVNSDSDMRSATIGSWDVSGLVNSGSGGLSSGFVRNRNKTPSSSRTNLGPSFFFSALHWPMTRMRRLFVAISWFSDELCIAGSHHHPSKSIPPSSLPPTRLRDMDMDLCKRASDLSSKAVPWWTVDNALIHDADFEVPGRILVKSWGVHTTTFGINVPMGKMTPWDRDGNLTLPYLTLAESSQNNNMQVQNRSNIPNLQRSILTA